ncbi:hypothetical protein CEXT_781631 [Caerostris extrusa]|uniref:Uncharacterized protein n=1 Tax=Caerostris extrusa TaxID=172846 RepID=A0AAV4WEA5_CAEEX|nr:hypothetical protein CEXT_781631 [Caerostris extrusa]
MPLQNKREKQPAEQQGQSIHTYQETFEYSDIQKRDIRIGKLGSTESHSNGRSPIVFRDIDSNSFPCSTEQ